MESSELLRRLVLLFQILGVLVAARPAPRPCRAQDARLNLAGPPFEERATEYVTVGVGADRFHVAYSARNGPNCESDITGDNAPISVFQLVNGRALIFGSGYGDRTQGGTCFTGRFDARTDAGLVDDILRRCLGMGDTELIFVAPHSHPDHMNPEFVYALEALGHTFHELWVHVGDEIAVRFIPPTPVTWDLEDQARIFSFGSLSSRCETSPVDPSTKAFLTTLGPVFFSRRDGHTPGSIDLVLQHVSGNYIVRGSPPPGGPMAGACVNSLYDNAVQLWEPHGNFVYR